MRTLIPLSSHSFYLWQMLVQISAGVDATWLVYKRGKLSPRLKKIMEAKVANIIVWDDWRTDFSYNPMMKPALVGQYLKSNPDLVSEEFVLIDPDVIPTGQPIAFSVDSVGWQGSNTDSYTGPGYLDSKGCLEPLCELVGVSAGEVRQYPGIGAQMAFTGQSGEWWLEVADTSVKAYNMMRKHPSDIQAWCAEMYITQLMMIRDGIEPTIEPTMDMVWADGHISGWDNTGYFHDAGVPTTHEKHFCKIDYQDSPWKKSIAVDPESASSRYVDLIKETAEKFPDLIW